MLDSLRDLFKYIYEFYNSNPIGNIILTIGVFLWGLSILLFPIFIGGKKNG